MKYLLVFLIPFLLLSLYGSCGNGGGDNGSSDNMECFSKENLVNSDCLAEDLLNICEQFFCGATFPPNEDGIQLAADFFFPPDDHECISVDCNTLDCEPPGSIFSDIQIGMNGRPTGLISTDPDVQFFCFEF